MSGLRISYDIVAKMSAWAAISEHRVLCFQAHSHDWDCPFLTLVGLPLVMANFDCQLD